MIIILSPSKNIKTISKIKIATSRPIFKTELLKIYSIIKKLEPFELESLMKVNPQLALKTFINFQNFSFDKKGTPAILAYSGLAFKNLNPEDFTLEEFNFANKHLRILSGFYGVLKACDEILPYRLEMQCKLKIENYKDLYQFWGDLIYKEIFKNRDIVLNLASDEYSSAITPFLTKNDKIINIKFQTLKNGKFRTIPTNAKVLRGKMARFIIKNKIKNTEDIKDFFENGYRFDHFLSTEDTYIFRNF